MNDDLIGLYRASADSLHFHYTLEPIRPRKQAQLEREAERLFFDAQTFKDRMEWFAQMAAQQTVAYENAVNKMSFTKLTGA
jgi:hypothetical protein